MNEELPNLRDGDVVEYVGSDSKSMKRGQRGKVYIARDSNGDAFIDFPPEGVGVWNRKSQRHLRVVTESD